MKNIFAHVALLQEMGQEFHGEGGSKLKNVMLEQINTIQQLYDYMSNKKDISKLQLSASNLCLYDGDTNADIMLIGEAPGETEDRLQKPFAGNSGTLIRNMLRCAGIRDAKIYITNTVYWRPPGNATPKESDIKACLPYLKKQIEIVKPKFILLCGNVACTTVSGLTITKAKGKFINDILELGIQCYGIYHPSYLLRRQKQKESAWMQILDFSNAVYKADAKIQK